MVARAVTAPTAAASSSTSGDASSRPPELSVTTVAHLVGIVVRSDHGRSGGVGAVGIGSRREPSTPRITVWRKLKRLGVAQIVDGLVALPLDARTKEQLEWIGDEILEAGGRPRSGVRACLGSVARNVPSRPVWPSWSRASTGTCIEAAAGRGREPAVRRRTRWRACVGSCAGSRQRDYFPPEERGDAARRWTRSQTRSRRRDERWATRAGRHVDRAACAWLIRRFVDADATFVFVDDPDEVPADATAVRHAGGRAVASRR